MLDHEKFAFFGEVPPASENKSAKRKQLRCVLHLQSSTRCLIFFFLSILSCTTDFAEKDGLLEV